MSHEWSWNMTFKVIQVRLSGWSSLWSTSESISFCTLHAASFFHVAQCWRKRESWCSACLFQPPHPHHIFHPHLQPPHHFGEGCCAEKQKVMGALMTDVGTEILQSVRKTRINIIYHAYQSSTVEPDNLWWWGKSEQDTPGLKNLEETRFYFWVVSVRECSLWRHCRHLLTIWNR